MFLRSGLFISARRTAAGKAIELLNASGMNPATGWFSDGSKRATRSDERNFSRLCDNCEIDSNPAERALRAIALGRKNDLLRMEIDP